MQSSYFVNRKPFRREYRKITVSTDASDGTKLTNWINLIKRHMPINIPSVFDKYYDVVDSRNNIFVSMSIGIYRQGRRDSNASTILTIILLMLTEDAR